VISREPAPGDLPECPDAVSDGTIGDLVSAFVLAVRA
jgi:hypothetical protein